MNQNRNHMFAGAVLIILGLGLFALQFTQGFGQSLTVFLIGGFFIAGYFYRRMIGLLIPGCLLIGLGLGSIGQVRIITIGDLGAIGLGVGFTAIYIIDRVVRGHTHWWPLVPGIILIVAGIIAGNANIERLVSIGWPLILVLAGFLFVAGAFGFGGRSRTGN